MNGNGLAPHRRANVRLKLRWPVLLYRNGEALSVSARTENISGGGFYCVSPESFTPGERLDACIFLPRVDPTGSNYSCLLRCEVEVVHVALHSQAGFGMGCRIHRYVFRRESVQQNHPASIPSTG